MSADRKNAAPTRDRRFSVILLSDCFKTASELINASACVNELLLAGKERMALRADVYTNVTALGGTGYESLSACADDLGFNVVGMDRFLHYTK